MVELYGRAMVVDSRAIVVDGRVRVVDSRAIFQWPYLQAYYTVGP